MINRMADDEVSEILNAHYAFFAFSNSQFSEKAVRIFKYVALGAGLYAPVQHAETLVDKINAVYDKAAKKVQSEKSKKDRIWYELANHECQITGEYQDALSALSIFDDITEEDVAAEWMPYIEHCRENNYF